MSRHNLGNLKYMPAETLANTLLAAAGVAGAGAGQGEGSAQAAGRLVVIDVRDEDYIGGHIRGSWNYPSLSLDATMPLLMRRLQEYDTVVFHCALSQQRGPSAALRYLRLKDVVKREADEAAAAAAAAAGATATAGDATAGDATATTAAAEGEGEGSVSAEGSGQGEKQQQQEPRKEQEVFVLRDGYSGWHRRYGDDNRLTEIFRKRIWSHWY